MVRSDFRNIFTYWNGNEFSLIKILRDIMMVHSKSGEGYEFIFIHPGNLNEYVDVIPRCFYDLLYAHQADYVRVYAVNKYGGIWLDADTIVMESLDHLFSYICNEGTDGFFIKENTNTICNGVFGSKPNTELMAKWFADMTKILDEKKQKIGWTEIGNSLLGKMKSNTKYFSKYQLFNGNENMYPVHYTVCYEEWIKKPYTNYQKIIRPFQPLILLSNRVYRTEPMKSLSPSDIMESMMPINYFINKSLKINIPTDKITRKTIFQDIYGKQIWNNGNSSVPKSGPGSALGNTLGVISFLDKFVDENKIESVRDIGCGDLTWIQKTNFFKNKNIVYQGFDIVPSVISENKKNFPDKIFEIVDAVNDTQIIKATKSDLLIIRDVIFHMTNAEILRLFGNIKNTFKYICITSSFTNKNSDTFNQWHFSSKNIKLEPFKKSNDHICVLDEKAFNRQMLIYQHDKFYN